MQSPQHRRQIPSLRQPLADHHVIEADDAQLQIGNVSAKQIGRFHDAGKALGQNRIQRDLAQIMQQAADERIGRFNTLRTAAD